MLAERLEIVSIHLDKSWSTYKDFNILDDNHLTMPLPKQSIVDCRTSSQQILDFSPQDVIKRTDILSIDLVALSQEEESLGVA